MCKNIELFLHFDPKDFILFHNHSYSDPEGEPKYIYWFFKIIAIIFSCIFSKLFGVEGIDNLKFKKSMSEELPSEIKQIFAFLHNVSYLDSKL